jgi:hypothetical protein
MRRKDNPLAVPRRRSSAALARTDAASRLGGCASRALLLVVALQVMTSSAAAQVPQGASPQALPTLQVLQELERPAMTTSVVWSSDGTKLAAYTLSSGGDIRTGSISGRLLTIWKADGQILCEIEPPEAFFFSDAPLALRALASRTKKATISVDEIGIADARSTAPHAAALTTNAVRTQVRQRPRLVQISAVERNRTRHIGPPCFDDRQS